MCDACEKYGKNGEYWYFNAENYARRIYKWRKPETEATGIGGVEGAEGGDASFAVGPMGSMHAHTIDMKVLDPEKYEQGVDKIGSNWHGLAQVVTLEEAQKIMELCWPITAMTCACRRVGRAVPDEENFSCMGMGPGMYKWERWPQIYHGGVHFLAPDEAKDFLAGINKKGWVHIVETHGTPYTGGICNCEYPLCAQMRARLEHDVWYSMKKGHYVAVTDEQACTGCKKCVERCHFSAINILTGNRKASVDGFSCFGCGNCRSVCPVDCITMEERQKFPALKNLW